MLLNGTDSFCRFLPSDEGNGNDSRMATNVFFFERERERERSQSACRQPELLFLMNNKPPPDHGLQKLDKDFIGNWITYLFYTYFINDTGFLHFSFFFFANITASCQQKKQKRQPKRTNSRWEWNTRLFQSSTLIRFSGIFEHKRFLMQTNKGFLKTKHTFRTQKNLKKEKKKKCWGCMKITEGARTFPPDMLTQCARR